MAKPVINQGAYGDGRSAAAGEGVKEAITGVEKDFAAADVKRKENKAEQDKLDKEEAAQEDENWEATEIKDDPADVLKGELEEGLRSMKKELSGLDLKTPEGRARKREIYTAYADVNKGLSSVNTLLQEYRTATGPNGKGIDPSTPPRVRKILMALDKNPGAFNLVYKDGMMRIVGEADGEKVDEPMGAYLSNLRFSPKQNWDTVLTEISSKLKGTETSFTAANGQVTKKTVYDPDARKGYIDKLLGGTKQQLLSLAARFGITPEAIAEGNLTDDQIKEQLRVKLDEELKKDDTSVVTKAAESEFSKDEIFKYNSTLSGLQSAITNKNPYEFGNIDPSKLAYYDTNADGDKLDDGEFILAPIGKDRKAHTERVFTSSDADLASAGEYAQNILLDSKAQRYLTGQQATRQAVIDRKFEETKARNLEFDTKVKDSPLAVKGATEPEKGDTPESKAIHRLWTKNNPPGPTPAGGTPGVDYGGLNIGDATQINDSTNGGRLNKLITTRFKKLDAVIEKHGSDSVQARSASRALVEAKKTLYKNTVEVTNDLQEDVEDLQALLVKQERELEGKSGATVKVRHIQIDKLVEKIEKAEAALKAHNATYTTK